MVDEGTRPAGRRGRHWLAVSFLPDDVGLAAGPAAERRAIPRPAARPGRPALSAAPWPATAAALAQRNSALRQGRPDLARAFDAPLAAPAPRSSASRLAWVEGAAARVRGRARVRWARRGPGCLRYRGGDGTRGARRRGPRRSGRRCPAIRRAGATTIGPHRDDLVLEIGGRPLREFGSNGQQRGAAVALKLHELAALRRRARHRAGAAAGRRVRGVRPRAPAAARPPPARRRPSARCSSRRRGGTSCRRTWRCRSGASEPER